VAAIARKKPVSTGNARLREALVGYGFVAVPMGVFFGSTPGLGGKLGLVLLIPFVYNMDQLTGAVFLCAMHAVVHTGGSIPSILIGVPGDGPAAATALDGYAMTPGNRKFIPDFFVD